jgi:hypothetical protein
MRSCNSCRGTGKCPRCDGSGTMTVGFFSKTEKVCDRCGGLGKCNSCNGIGQLSHSSSEINRVRCPKCGTVMEVTTDKRPLQIPCECGTTLMLKR